MVRYYGYHSNKTRGVRQRGLPPEGIVRKPGISGQTAFQEVARCHPQSLAHRPASLSQMRRNDASHNDH